MALPAPPPDLAELDEPAAAPHGGYYYAHKDFGKEPSATQPAAPEWKALTDEQAAALAAASADVTGAHSNSKWNANNYHWEERDYSTWASNRLNELCTGVSVAGKTFSVCSSGAEVKGEAANAIRKAKKIVTYEFTSIVVAFDGSMGETAVAGTVTFTNVQEDTEPAE
jgi:hypothetical protein